METNHVRCRDKQCIIVLVEAVRRVIDHEAERKIFKTSSVILVPARSMATHAS